MERTVWATLADYHHDGHAVTLITPYPIRLKKNICLKFGVKEVPCTGNQLVIKEAKDLMETTRTETGVVLVSTALKRTLGIPTNLVYRMLLKEDSITVGPTIGLLLGTKINRYTPEFMAENYADRMGIYPQIGGMIVAYSTAAVDWNNKKVRGLMYLAAKQAWTPVETTIPKVTYRRHIMQPNFRDFRRSLVKNNGILFNSIRYSKWLVYKIFKKNPVLDQHMPETILLNSQTQLRNFLASYPKIILKPKCGSRGKGIFVIEHCAGAKFKITDYRQHKNTERNLCVSLPALFDFLEKGHVFGVRKYICQQFIDLMTINNTPFDIRVLQQKDRDRKWHCGGIECRLASPDKVITNLAAGGRAMSLPEAAGLMDSPVDLNRLYKEIYHICNECCFWMDQQRKQHYGEFGIDIGLDKQGKIWLIEVNFRPGFKGFKMIDYNLYLEIGYRPLRYAASLQGFDIDTEITKI